MSLKGHVFDKQLFSNQMYALFQDTFLDGESGILPNFKKSGNNEGMSVYSSGRQLFIRNGAACICGRFVEETDSVYEITDIPEGNNYCVLVIEIDLSKVNTTEQNGFKQAYYRILSDANAYPTLTQQDITNTNLTGVFQFELARFQTTSSAITNLSTANVNKLDIDSVYHKFDSEIQAKLEELDEEIALIDGGTLGPIKDKMKVRRYGNGEGILSYTLPNNWETDYNFIEFIYGKRSSITGANAITLKSTGLISAFYDNLNHVICDSTENIYNSVTNKYTVQLLTGRLKYNYNNRVVTLDNQTRVNIDVNTKAMYFANNSTSQFVPELGIYEVRLYKFEIEEI